MRHRQGCVHPLPFWSASPEKRKVKVTRNFECEPAEPIAIPSVGTVPAVGLLLSEETVTGVVLAGAAWCKDGHQFGHTVSRQSPGVEGEK